MQQLSRPYQIALGALLLFAVAWFTVLKPSDASSSQPVGLPPTIAAQPAQPAGAAASVPGVSGLGRAVAKAEVAKDTVDATARAAAAEPDAVPAATPADPRAAGSAAQPTGSPAAAKAAVPTKDPSAPVLRDVARGKVAVLLFFSPLAADDLAVRRALRHTNRHGGRVVVRVASIARIADYAAITEGVKVTQAPSLLVIGKGGHTRMLVGFTDTESIDQLVEDVGGPAFAARRPKR